MQEVFTMQPVSPATFTESLAQLRRALADADPLAAGADAPFAAAETVAATFTAAPEGERPRLLLRALDEAIAAVEIAARLADELHGSELRPEAFEEGQQPAALTLAYREFIAAQAAYAPLYAYRNTLAGQVRVEAQPAPHERSAETERSRVAVPAPAEDAAAGMSVDRLNDTSAYQRCFACGARNMAGLRLVFRQEGEEIVTEFTPGERFQGFPGVVHGGILATLLDETLSRTATVEGRWMMTGRLEIRYRGPAPVGRALRVTARTISSRARMVRASGEIRLADAPATLIATADGTFLPVPPHYQDDVVERYPELAGFFAI
jgi:acyl-coenzyme A thioesterase PaaI-like protein